MSAKKMSAQKREERLLPVPDAAPLKEQLRSYFDGIGFERWSAIYGQQHLSPIRRSIRDGHATMLDQAESWLRERYGSATNAQALDAGCGTGLFTVRLARQGFRVTSVDIAPQMVAAAREQAQQAGVESQITWITGDLERVAGSYDVVSCFDVLIHYPAVGFEALCSHLAGLCRETLLMTYAPHSPLLAAMHRIGGYFPKNHRRTEIQMIRDRDVQRVLKACGLQIRRTARISKGFYHVTLLEASR